MPACATLSLQISDFVYAEIWDPEYTLLFPSLFPKTWDSVLSGTEIERESFKVAGRYALHSAVSRLLSPRISKFPLGYYGTLETFFISYDTVTHLMRKVTEPNNGRHPALILKIRHLVEAFYILVGGVVNDLGSEGTFLWLEGIFSALIKIAENAFVEYHASRSALSSTEIPDIEKAVEVKFKVGPHRPSSVQTYMRRVKDMQLENHRLLPTYEDVSGYLEMHTGTKFWGRQAAGHVTASGFGCEKGQNPQLKTSTPSTLTWSFSTLFSTTKTFVNREINAFNAVVFSPHSDSVSFDPCATCIPAKRQSSPEECNLHDSRYSSPDDPVPKRRRASASQDITPRGSKYPRLFKRKMVSYKSVRRPTNPEPFPTPTMADMTFDFSFASPTSSSGSYFAQIGPSLPSHKLKRCQAPSQRLGKTYRGRDHSSVLPPYFPVASFDYPN